MLFVNGKQSIRKAQKFDAVQKVETRGSGSSAPSCSRVDERVSGERAGRQNSMGSSF